MARLAVPETANVTCDHAWDERVPWVPLIQRLGPSLRTMTSSVNPPRTAIAVVTFSKRTATR
jgi:hypothetical protein